MATRQQMATPQQMGATAAPQGGSAPMAGFPGRNNIGDPGPFTTLYYTIRHNTYSTLLHTSPQNYTGPGIAFA